jgi:hypothetical protein
LTDRARIHRFVSSGRGSEKGSGGPAAVPEPSRPFLLPGQSNPDADVQPVAIPVNQLRDRGTGPSVAAASRATPAAASAAPARLLGAKPVGKKGCRIAGKGCGWRAQSALRTPDGRSKKTRIAVLGAGPRTPAPHIRTRCPAPRDRPPRLRPRAGARRSDTDTAGFGPGVSPDHWSSAGTVG